MKQIKLFGFENLPEGFLTGTPPFGHGAAYSDLVPIMITGNSANAFTPRILNDKLQFGKTAQLTGQIEGSVAYPMTAFIGDSTPTFVSIGVRIDRPISSSTINIINLRSGIANPGTVLQQLVLASSVIIPSNSYFEIVLDMVARTYTIFRDEVQIASAALVAGVTQANLSSLYLETGRAGTNWVSTGGSGIPYDVWSFSDMYCIYEDGVAPIEPVSRLGAVSVKRLPVVSAVGAGYVPSNAGTVVDVLNTDKVDPATLIAPKVAVPSDGTPLKVKFDTSPIGDFAIKGIDIKVGGLKDVAGDRTLSGAVTSNGSSSPSINIPMTAAAAPVNTRVMSGPKLPDGGGLSVVNIGAMEVVITPG
ncbi:hypothetical protein D3C85_223610 [compost metagenome]